MSTEARDWSFQLFKCCETPKLVLWFILLPCFAFSHMTCDTFGKIPKGRPILRCILSHFFPIVCFAYNRSLVRKHFNIKGNLLKDLFITYCCLCCALIQENREATKEQPSQKQGDVSNDVSIQMQSKKMVNA